ncbi:MAG TPA: AGE family epimerase/isomerase [Balneolales bacterium]|nr:AGE family epimerase/isomerase [Balneolales bacterium]
MDEVAVLKKLGDELSKELLNNIIPYWTNNAVDEQNGGFVGRIAYDNTVDAAAPKGLIMNARLLWTFSACHRQFRRKILRDLADRAYSCLLSHFFDDKYGGFYWMLNAKRQVLDDRKHIYAQSFAIYSLSEYFLAFGCRTALDIAGNLYRLVELKSGDPKNGGYFEAFSRDWQLHEDARLSEKDINEPKSMNTHLHLLEAYTNLYRCNNSADLKNRLEILITIFLDHIIAEDGTHLVNFLNDDWKPRSGIISYGHDIESAWLLQEAAEVIGDKGLRDKIVQSGTTMAWSVLRNGLDQNGGLVTEADQNGITNDDKEWWPQAEALVGFLNAYENTGDQVFLNASLAVWQFIKKFIVDFETGDWVARVNRDGISYKDDKVCDWKCSYHNSRACLEGMRRTSRIANKIETRRSPVKPSSL